MEIPAPITINEDENASSQKKDDQDLMITKKMMKNNSSNPPRLYLLYGIIILQSVIFLSEMIIDQMVHSMLILADAYHHLFNSFNAILLVVCYKISNQMTVTNTFGWVRTELLGMLTTITFIVALIFSLLIEGALQLLHLHEISGPTNPKVLIIFGVWSLIVNVLYVLIINGVVTDKKYKQTTQKERSFSTAKCQKSQKTNVRKSTTAGILLPSFPHSSGGIHPSTENLDLITIEPSSLIDESSRVEFTSSPLPPSESQSSCFCRSFVQGILSPCFVIFCSVLITLFQASKDLNNVEMIDPLIGIITAISLCITFYPQMKNTFLILMQTVPEGVNIVQLKQEILERFQVIQNIHEFHIWLLTGSNIVATCHIVLPQQSTFEYSRLFEEIKNFLQMKYGIRYITIQPEFNPNETSKSLPNSHQELRRHSSCLNQCLVKCPCDRNGNCGQCTMKSCCLSVSVTNIDEPEFFMKESCNHSAIIESHCHDP